MSEATRTLTGDQYTVSHTVGYNQPGLRLDQFLMQRYRHRSRAKLKKAIESGAISIVRNQSPHLHLGKIKPSFVLHGGDLVKVVSTKRREPPVNFDYKILFEDESILVIDKPPNLPVHPAGKYFFNTLLVHLKTNGFKNDLAAERQFFLVHRIDKETSGVLLLAKTSEACNALTTQFRNRETGKYYLAITKGAPTVSKFEVDSAIGKIKGSKIGLKMYTLPEAEGGLPSFTSFEVIETREGKPAIVTKGPGNTPFNSVDPTAHHTADHIADHTVDTTGKYTLLACFPKTGRQHQIRVHADAAGFPLVGDKIYGISDEDGLLLIDRYRDEMMAELASEASPEPVEAMELIPEEGEIEDENSDEAEALMVKNKIREHQSKRFETPAPTAETYAEAEARLILPRHALHAAGLKFKHPITGEELVFESGLPDDLRSFFESITGQPLAPFRTKYWA
jgi:RluA family pseudouridine synthase